MSAPILEEFDEAIDNAYKEMNQSKIKKESFAILNAMAMYMTVQFPERLNRVIPNVRNLNFNDSFISSGKNREALLNWLERMNTMKEPADDIAFGKLKVNFEEWFYAIGGTDIQFEYHDTYLITPSEAAEQLGVSTVTINNYVKRGFEYIDNRSHRRIPKHMIPLWKDPEYAIKIQMMYQQQKLRHEKPDERLKEIMEAVLSFQIKYRTETVKEAFPIIDGDKPNELADYYEWESLEKERQALKESIFSRQTDD